MMRVVILLLLVASLAVFRGDFNCPSNNFIPKKGYVVVDHVLASYYVTWEWGCVEKCQQDRRCRSFNYQHRAPPGNPHHICETNTVTRDFDNGKFYQYRTDFTYYESEVIQATPPPPVTYLLHDEATSHNCDTVCNSKRLHCTTVYHGFTNDNVLALFNSFGVFCSTGKYDNYLYPDSPLYFNGSSWKGFCVGWKNIPLKINCNMQASSSSRRLCPCVSVTI